MRLFGHELHALAHVLVRRHGHHRRTHDLPDRRLGRGTPEQDHLARVVALGDHADQLAVARDRQRPHVLVGHELDRLEHRLLDVDRPDVVALPSEQLLDAQHATIPRAWRASPPRARSVRFYATRRRPVRARDPAEHRQRDPAVREHGRPAAPRQAAGVPSRRTGGASLGPRLPRAGGPHRARRLCRLSRGVVCRTRTGGSALVRADDAGGRRLRRGALRSRTTCWCSVRRRAACPKPCWRRARPGGGCGSRCARMRAA